MYHNYKKSAPGAILTFGAQEVSWSQVSFLVAAFDSNRITVIGKNNEVVGNQTKQTDPNVFVSTTFLVAVLIMLIFGQVKHCPKGF